ncbi:cytochrome C [Flaviaesturariibacter flavus]|uniref:Cytochrome C n=1 Tax=Flaviaesturariibacter flavus TaxID=2502780 RepID=A0A4R1BBD3_9BACT|nr:heme-binding domain-containing protein [Flaviaesturariibacter flavus]TCJ14274.1 cytochrome C [Flaviaesturariibacter flavus]
MRKRILLILLAILVILQFIRPERNESTAQQPGSILNGYPASPQVTGILKKACFDCHSNNTHYPWYTNIQPVGWWMQHHVDEGKRKLNFDEFRTYNTRKQVKKMEETVELVKKGEMPLDSYTWIHKDAKLDAGERQALTAWADSVGKAVASQRPENQ